MMISRRFRGMTLMEVLVSLAIFVSLFAGILTILASSDRSWRIGQNKITEQREARRAMDNITRLLRQSNPDWVVGGTHYPVSINEGGTRIDFYQPVFDAVGSVSGLRKITFKLNQADSSELLKKEGTAETYVVADDITALSFGGGCSGCLAFNCTAVAVDCPRVRIDIRTRRDNDFNLTSEILLRNTNIGADNDTQIEQPPEGEF